MVFRAAEYVKNSVVNAIRAIFSLGADEIAPYRWNSDLKQTKIFVYRADPTAAPTYPAIIVTAAVGEIPIQTYFDDDVKEDNLLPTQIGGKFTIDVTVSAIAQSTVDKEHILNILLKGLVYVSRSIFNSDGIVLENPIRIGGESLETYGGATPYYMQSLTMSFYTEWEETLTDFTNLSKIYVAVSTIPPDEQ